MIKHLILFVFIAMFLSVSAGKQQSEESGLSRLKNWVAKCVEVLDNIELATNSDQGTEYRQGTPGFSKLLTAGIIAENGEFVKMADIQKMFSSDFKSLRETIKSFDKIWKQPFLEIVKSLESKVSSGFGKMARFKTTLRESRSLLANAVRPVSMDI